MHTPAIPVFSQQATIPNHRASPFSVVLASRSMDKQGRGAACTAALLLTTSANCCRPNAGQTHSVTQVAMHSPHILNYAPCTSLGAQSLPMSRVRPQLAHQTG